MLEDQASNTNVMRMRCMARTRQSRDWPSGNMGAVSASKLISAKGFWHSKKSERYLLAIFRRAPSGAAPGKNIVPAQREGISRILHTCGAILDQGQWPQARKVRWNESVIIRKLSTVRVFGGLKTLRSATRTVELLHRYSLGKAPCPSQMSNPTSMIGGR